MRDLVLELIVRDLKLRYRRTSMGVIWLFVFPLVQILVLNFVFTVVLPAQVHNYAIFVAIGVLVWTWFQSSLIMATTSITGNRELIRRPGMPAAALPVTTVATNLVLLLVAMPAVVGLAIYSGGEIGPNLELIPVAVLVQFVLTLGLAYLVAALNVTFRDTQHLVPLFLLLAFFVSPIFYDVSNVPDRYRALYDLNPFVVLLQAYRAPFTHEGSLTWLQIGEVGLFALALGLAGHLIFRRASRNFADEL